MRRPEVRDLLLALAVLLGVTATTGSLRSGDMPGNGDSWALGVLGICFAALGWLVAGRAPRLPIGWLLLAGGVAETGSGLASWWAREALLRAPGSLPGEAAAAWVAAWSPVVAWPLVFVVPLLLFPDGVPRSRRWRRFLVLLTAVLGALIVAAAGAAVPAALDDPAQLLDAPGIESEGAAAAAIGFQSIARLLEFVATLVVLVGTALARRRSTGDQRRQYTTVLAGFASVAAVILLAGLVPALTDQRREIPEAVGALSAVAIPASITVAVVRFRLYEIRAALSRSVLVAGTGAALAAVYFAVLGLLAVALDDSGPLTLPGALAAGAVAIVAAPMAAAVRQAVRRGFGRAPVVARFTDNLAAEDVDALEGLARVVRAELRLGYVALDVPGLPPCGLGVAEGDLTTVELRHGAEALGRMVVGPRPGETLAAPDLRLVHEIAVFVGVCAAAIRVSAELRESQAAVAGAHLEERRRVRRDLHDGIGPGLAAVRMKLTSARRRLPADAGLDEIVDQVTETIQELRRVVDGLAPSVLEDLGLLPALHVLVADVARSSGLRLELHPPEHLPEPSLETSIAVYRVVSEALANVTRHSRASACTVRLTHADGVLSVEIRDDGCGFDPTAAGGNGLRNIAGRSAAVRGSAEVVSAPGAGTSVTVRVPTGSAA